MTFVEKKPFREPGYRDESTTMIPFCRIGKSGNYSNSYSHFHSSSGRKKIPPRRGGIEPVA
ncbi:MAG: hypothetical protein A2X11_01700 [Bacteroidetes bacterium GWE2_42_24]|nr:MAG: hypothetical protein A2X11_01700 [Bacteroidetes bacterium GWE2_42_24]OFY29721.1 MAG: hypothetical protein A2X09_01475 [Bacteroidetes bacterium GWF2_43_11]PKP24479.1 MAG: hypothetical protein CVU06_04890 [Bacteroidetes bacterium HGW-Bacteroidetes-22]